MIIRQFTAQDLPAVMHVESVAWGENAATKEQILCRAKVCPEGSLVAQHLNGDVVGYASAQRIASLSSNSWEIVTDNGTITNTHIPNGPIAFGVGMSVLPEAARFRVSDAIIQQYAKTFVVEGGCYLMALGSRLPGFRRWLQLQKDVRTIDEYLRETRKGLSRDPELCLYQKAGFKLMWPVKDYFPDSASENWGAIICMDRIAILGCAS